MPFFERELAGLLRPIHEKLKEIHNVLKEIREMSTNAVTQAQFTADLGALQTLITTFITNVQSDIAALKAAVAAGQPPDFSALDATVQAVSAAVTTENTAVVADQAPPATTPPAA